ncbi:MAG: TIGR02328 family protein [Pelosinus sp.]|nr:TIGR02328 family protein [Pelosinus sp.]
MRLWHISLIEHLPRQQLLGQHRECCALRGKGWGKRHATVNYVFSYDPLMLYQYHMAVIKEMKRRGYHVDKLWLDPKYRGKLLGYTAYETSGKVLDKYQEHDERYLQECVANLKKKGVEIEGITSCFL